MNKGDLMQASIEQRNTVAHAIPAITVLLSTYNGEKYLREQLDSLLAQRDVALTVLARDDGSTDETTGILDEYAQRYPCFSWYANGHLGPAKSFLDLLRHSIPTQYYAFCDQDDVWAQDKLSRAASFLGAADDRKPAVYFSSLELVDANLNHIGEIHVDCAHTFGQALVRNNAAGCTMVFNQALRELAGAYAPAWIPMHDQWIYAVCALYDGQTFVDQETRIQYRQHGKNAVGGVHGLTAVFRRRFDQYRSHAKPRKRLAAELYAGYGGRMDEEKKRILRKIMTYDASLRSRLQLMGEPAIRYPGAGVNLVTLGAIVCNVF